MAKRRANDDEGSDDEAAEMLSATKRARVDNNDDDGHVREEPTEEEKQFEATYSGKIMASIEAKQNTEGRIAEYGIIQSLELQHFMCHSRLSFSFGPQINFVIGKNGSGKSAVLTALTIALGGKAATTGRGSGLKSFIKEGHTWAEVTVSIKNEGPEAYRPDVYGKSIIISRNFTQSGSSSYKIKSKDGKTVSTKREELEHILDHMNIQVDNPLNVLTQDTSRQFINGASPKVKYEFFLKGTQLQQLSEEYEMILENIGKTSKILRAKKEVIPDLKKSVAEAQNRLKGARMALQTRGRITELKHEQAWAHVADKEEEMKKKIEEVAKKTRKLPKLQSKVDDAKKAHTEHSELIAELEDKIKDLGDIDHLNRRKSELSDALRANKTEIRKYQANEKEMTIELNTAKNTIDDLKKRIDVETRKLQEDKKAEQEERQRKLEAVKHAITQHEARRNEINDELRQIEERLNVIKRDLAQEQNSMNNSRSAAEHASRQLYELNQQSAGFDEHRMYGANLRQVNERIKGMRWHGKLPVGPLGVHMSLRDKKWANVLRATLGNMMVNYAVTDARDRPMLRKLLLDFKNPHVQIVVAAEDEFDYRSGEPRNQDLVTVLRVLEFSSEYVKRIFINANRIERTLLAPTRAEAQRLAEEARGEPSESGRGSGGSAISADLYRVIAYPEGGSYSQPIQDLKQNDFKRQFFAFNDPKAARQHWTNEKERATTAANDTKVRIDALTKELDSLNKQKSAYSNEARALEGELFTARQNLRNMQNQHNDDVPVNIASLEDALKEAEETRDNIINQYRDLVTARTDVDQKQKPLLEEVKKIKAQIEEFETKKSDLEGQVVDASGKRSKASKEIEIQEGKLKIEQAEVEKCEAAAKQVQEEFEIWTKQAEEFCDGNRVENPRKLADVERELHSVQEALKRQEKENGASIEELEEALAEAKERYTNVQKDLDTLMILNQKLKQSVFTRLQRWHDFRRHIALRTKLLFSHNLANRDYYGKAIFYHEDQKLELKIQTEDVAMTQGLNKDPKSLSGGERSFSTICLLMALWEAIGCPIRCLDEFDVFMDAVNRKVAMKMMIETANVSDSKQYILITPQDMSAITWGPSVRVHRMRDPERNQRTLDG